MTDPTPPSTPSRGFTKSFTAGPGHIDELGHVNNAVWVQWIQDSATAHCDSAARPEGETAIGETFIPDAPRGATSVRAVEFTDASGKKLVSARTTWAMLDRASQRLVRVRPDVIAPFQISD